MERRTSTELIKTPDIERVKFGMTALAGLRIARSILFKDIEIDENNKCTSYYSNPPN